MSSRNIAGSPARPRTLSRGRYCALSLVLVPTLACAPALPALAAEVRPSPGSSAHRVAGAAPSRLLTSRVGQPASVRGATAASPSTRPVRGIYVNRITARPKAIKDAAGNTWGRLPLTVGTSNRAQIAGVTAPKRADVPLYSWVARNAKGHRLNVPTGTYRVRLLLMDPVNSAAGKRVFDVQAEGRTAVSRVDIAKSAGRLRGHDVTFTVRVNDGALDLRFVPKAGDPIVSAIEVTSTGPVALADDDPGHAVDLSSASPYFQKVRNAPVAPNSAKSIAGLVRQVSDHWGGTAATNAFQYNGAFYSVPRGTKRVRVGFHDCQKKRAVPAGLYDGAKHFVDVPVPKGATPASGTDGQLTVYDKAADQLWEFWQMRRTSNGGWEACWGGRIDKVSQSIGQFPYPYGASASGLPVAAGMITIAEARAGRINHAMSLAILDAARWDKFSWPATRSDGISKDPHALMEGQRIRLDPRLDLDRYDLGPFARMVAEAAQEYGFIITDRSGAVAVSTESGAAEKARTGENPWSVLLGGEAYLALRNFPWDKMQALPKNYGKP